MKVNFMAQVMIKEMIRLKVTFMVQVMIKGVVLMIMKMIFLTIMTIQNRFQDTGILLIWMMIVIVMTWVIIVIMILTILMVTMTIVVMTMMIDAFVSDFISNFNNLLLLFTIQKKKIILLFFVIWNFLWIKNVFYALRIYLLQQKNPKSISKK